MPTAMHEALIEVFRHRPSLAAELLTDQFGVSLPPHQEVRLDCGDLTNVIPTEYRTDAVVVLADRNDPALAVLSAMAHPTHPDREKIFYALLNALRTVDAERATLYHDVVLAALPTAARRHLEALMSAGLREYQSDFVRKYVFQGRAEGRVEGKAKGKAEDVLAVLAARGIDVPEDVRARITGCTDLDQLDTWIRRAATAEGIADVFED